MGRRTAVHSLGTRKTRALRELRSVPDRQPCERCPASTRNVRGAFEALRRRPIERRLAEGRRRRGVRRSQMASIERRPPTDPAWSATRWARKTVLACWKKFTTMDVFPNGTRVSSSCGQISGAVWGGMSGTSRNISRPIASDRGSRPDRDPIGAGLPAEHPVIAVVHDAGHLAASPAHERTPCVVVGTRSLHVLEGAEDQIPSGRGESTVWTQHGRVPGARCPTEQSSARHGSGLSSRGRR